MIRAHLSQRRVGVGSLKRNAGSGGGRSDDLAIRAALSTMIAVGTGVFGGGVEV